VYTNLTLRSSQKGYAKHIFIPKQKYIKPWQKDETLYYEKQKSL